MTETVNDNQEDAVDNNTQELNTDDNTTSESESTSTVEDSDSPFAVKDSDGTKEENSNDSADTSITASTISEDDYLDKTHQNVEHQKEIDGPLPKNFKEHKSFYLSFLRHTITEFQTLADNFPKGIFTEGEKGQDWVRFIESGVGNFIQGNALLSSLSRETSHWVQAVETEGTRIAAGRPGIGKEAGEGELLTGDRAMFQVMGALGLGSIIQIPLWHSGIWVSIKAPSDSELLLLDQRLGDEKILLGNSTSGLLYSNNSVFLNNHLINFAIDHIYDSTLKDSTPENLRKVLRSNDIPILIWGLACSIYPNGYPHARPCIAEPSKCQHVTETMLYLPRLCWTDKGALTKAQVKHMVNRRSKHSIETVQAYQDAHQQGEKRVVKLNDSLSIVLKVPNITEYIKSGFEWIEGITEMIDSNFGTSLRGEDRDRRIMAQGNVTTMRQHAHWIDKFLLTEEGKDPSVIESRETVDRLLSNLSGEEAIRTKVFEEIGKFIDDSTISLIGIPRYKCSSCGKPQGSSEEDGGHRFIIPIDVANLFFTLQRRRIDLGVVKT